MRVLKTVAAVAGLLVSSTPWALDFSQTWFFGDSLSDSGAYLGNPDAGDGGRFTTNPGPVWPEWFAMRLGTTAAANNPANPRTDPLGTDYAQGGAQVTNPVGIGQTPSPQNALPISDQVTLYLDRVDGRAGRKALFSVWGGANDVFFNMGLVSAGLPLEQALVNVGGSAAQLMGQIGRLRDAGARYLLVPLLPDIGRTPAWVLETVSAAGEGNPAQGDALVAAATVLAMGGSDAEQVRLQALAAGEAALGLPAGSLLPAYLGASGLATGLSSAFNAALVEEAKAGSANVILLDTWSLFGEIEADPGSVGLANVTGTACATPTALYCTPDTLIDPRAPQFFLYADGVHPTTAGHRIFADYAYSVVTAPALISTLPGVALGVIRGHQDLLLGQVRGGFGEGWSFFAAGTLGSQEMEADQGGKADADDVRLMGGVARRLDQAWVVGGALDGSRSEADFQADQGGFELNAVEFSLFADYRKEKLYATLLGTLSFQADLDDVKRVVKLGGGVRSEKGSTRADLWALKGVAGYRLWEQGGFSVGPFGSLNYQSAEVDGYREKGSRSTSMNFAGQKVDSFLLEAGLFADYRFSRTILHGGLSYEAELEDDDRKVGAGLNSLPGSRFHLYDVAPSDHYWKLDLSLDSQVARGVGLGIGYLLRKGESGNRQQEVNLGIRVSF